MKKEAIASIIAEIAKRDTFTVLLYDESETVPIHGETDLSFVEADMRFNFIMDQIQAWEAYLVFDKRATKVELLKTSTWQIEKSYELN